MNSFEFPRMANEAFPDMSVEANRLQTFSVWAPATPMPANRMAKAGFYATGDGCTVECHWCHVRINIRNSGDEINEIDTNLLMLMHRRFNPFCPFVHSRSFPTEQVNQTPDDSESSNSVTTTDYKIEEHRLASFQNWPVPFISPQTLAKAGFYFFNESDQVRCAWCQGVVGQWEIGDNPFVEHQRFFPECPSVRDLGIQQVRPPKAPKFAMIDARLRSFENWPHSTVQKPEVLAQAGFYFQDVEDQVRCFHCDGGLRHWLRDDDPWFEHARWFPKCQFVQLVKGSQYVDGVQVETRDRSIDPHSASTVEGRLAFQPVMSLDEAMRTGPVKLALHIGLNEGRVRSATKYRLEQTGKPFSRIEYLTEAVLANQFYNEESSSTQEGEETFRNSARIIDTLSSLPSSSSTQSRHEEENGAESTTIDIRSRPSSYVPEVANDIINTQQRSECEQQNIKINLSEAKEIASTEAPDYTGNVQTIQETTIDDGRAKKSLVEENRKLKEARQCKVCMDDEIGVVFLRCGHLVTCVQCATIVTNCPLCRAVIQGFVRAFLP